MRFYDGKYGAAFNLRGLAQYSSGQYAPVFDFSEAIWLDPRDALAYNNRGMAHDRMGDFKRAIADYDEAILLDPNDDTAHEIGRGATAK